VGGKKSDLAHIRIFGSKAFAHIPKNFRKLDFKARKTLLMRYQGDSTNHKLYDPKIRQIFVTRDVAFNKKPRSIIKAATKEKDSELNLKQVQQAPTKEEKPRAADAILAVLDATSRGSTRDCKNPPHCTKRNAQFVRDLTYQLRDRESICLLARYEANLAEFVISLDY